MQRICALCGKEFTSTKSREKYCGQQCRWKTANDRRQRIKEEKRGPRNCAYCGVVFKPSDPRKTYCSKRCGAHARRRESLNDYRTTDRERYARNRVRILASLREKYALNPEKHKEKERLRRLAHGDEINRRVRERKAKQRARLAEAERILARNKGGRPADDLLGAEVHRLWKLGLKWPAIKAQLDSAKNGHKEPDAYRKLHDRYLDRHPEITEKKSDETVLSGF
jgi:hypothetical protein